jgi:hypothetical protein
MSTTSKIIARDHDPLYVLVDYDNVIATDRAKGVDFVIHKILDAVSAAAGAVLPDNVRIRLYGGWYRNSSMTRQAQTLIQTSNYFASPIPRVPTGALPSRRIRLMAELARTLLSVNGSRINSDIINTCRTRRFPTGCYRVESQRHPRCEREYCFLDDLKAFVRDGRCPNSPSSIDLTASVTRDEQKLVDVMLATDLLHLAFTTRSHFAALVSSDDDMWPAIIEAANTGTILFHIHTRTRSGLEHYENFVKGPRYIVSNLTGGV